MITFDPDALKARLAELEQAMGAPGFWDDQAQAARISTEHSRVQRRLERYERLRHDYEDAQELYAMDGDMQDEIAASSVTSACSTTSRTRECSVEIFAAFC